MAFRPHPERRPVLVAGAPHRLDEPVETALDVATEYLGIGSGELGVKVIGRGLGRLGLLSRLGPLLRRARRRRTGAPWRAWPT